MYDKAKWKPLYEEDSNGGLPFREAYLASVQRLIEKRRAQCQARRDAFGASISEKREEARRQYLEMLGWPLTEEPQPVRSVRQILIKETDGYQVYRMQLEIFEDFWFYGILMLHKGKTGPLAISQHGGDGTPEYCSSFIDSANYNDMSVRLFRRGLHVFAPQTLMWKGDLFGPHPMRNERDNDLKQLGGSIAALEIYCIGRCLDYLEAQPYCNGKLGMAGLSYGGFYTLYTAAADTRIQAALACSHFNDRITYNWPDKVWKNAAATFLDAEVGALVCPRRLILEVGDKDELFDADLARREYERLKGYYKEAPDKLSFAIFSGNHEFCPEDQGIEAFVAALQ